MIKKVKRSVLNTAKCAVNAYFKQREKELTSSRDKWKKKAMDKEATILRLQNELNRAQRELKKSDSY